MCLLVLLAWLLHLSGVDVCVVNGVMDGRKRTLMEKSLRFLKESCELVRTGTTKVWDLDVGREYDILGVGTRRRVLCWS